MRPRITIVALSDAAQAQALRAVAEVMGHDVRLLRPRAEADVAPTLDCASADDVVILSAHGGAQGLYLADVDAGNDGHTQGGWVAATAAFSAVAFRDDSVLISTAGAARESGLVAAMFHAGGHLIAPNGTPDRRVIVPWIAACLLRADGPLVDAVAAANTLVSPDDQFTYG